MPDNITVLSSGRVLLIKHSQILARCAMHMERDPREPGDSVDKAQAFAN